MAWDFIGWMIYGWIIWISLFPKTFGIWLGFVARKISEGLNSPDTERR